MEKLPNKYKEIPLAVKATVWFTICGFLQKGISMLTTPIFTRVLSQEEYGVVSTFFSWHSIFSLIVTLSLYKSLMNLFLKHKDKDAVLSNVVSLELIISLVWFVVVIIFRQWISGLMKMSVPLIICLFALFIFESATQCWMLRKRYDFQYKQVIIITLLSTLLSTFGGVACVLLIDATAEMRIIPYTIAIALIGIVTIFLVYKKRRTFFNRKVWGFSLGFCVALLPHYLSEFILSSSDKLMINYMCGSTDVAIYSVAYSVGSLINLVTSAINTSFAPYQYQEMKKANYRELSKVANLVLAFVALMLIFVMFFGREVVLVFGGNKYLESAEVIIPICVGLFFNYVFQLFARVQEYYEHKLLVVIPSVLCAILNLVLNYIFIQLYNYQAAAFTTAVCYFVFCVLHYFFYRHVCKKDNNGTAIYDIKGIMLISAFVIILGVVLFILKHIFWLKYVFLGLSIIIAIIFRKKLVSSIKKIFGKKDSN